MYVWKREHKIKRLHKEQQWALWKPKEQLWRITLLTRAACSRALGMLLKASKETEVLKKWPLHAEWHCRSYASHVILARQTAPMSGCRSCNKQEYWVIFHILLGIGFKPGADDSPLQSEFMKRGMHWVFSAGRTCKHQQTSTGVLQMSPLHALTWHYSRLVLTQAATVY